MNEVGSTLRLMVAARREMCQRWSDTLFIVLHLTDTVPVSDLGSILWYMYDPALPESDRTVVEPEFPLCPGTTIRLGVENESAAPAYRWQFPDATWQFLPSQSDTTAAVVNIVVGQKPGVIRVSPLTDPYNRQCTYSADANALKTQPIELKPALPQRTFVTAGANAFNDAPCAGVALTYAIEGPGPDDVDILHYRWEFPEGWRVYAEDGTLLDNNQQEPAGLTCRVLPNATPGIVRAYVISQCGEFGQSYSEPAERAVNPMDTARLKIIAEETVCKDSTLRNMEIKALNEWTYGTGYGLTVTYIGSDATVITPDNPLVFHFPKAPDSSLVDVDWYSGDSVRLTFTPRHTGGCPNVLPVTYALRADTIPAIYGFITGPARICMGAEETFEAKTTNLNDDVAVTYHWEVPEDEGWEIVSGADEAVAVIKAGWYEGEPELKKIIRCYPRALCGTAAPFEDTVIVNPPADFNGTLEATLQPASNRRPSTDTCIGDDVKFTLTDLTHEEDASQVKYVWETPAGWTPLTPVEGNSPEAEFTASRAGVDTVRVRFQELNNPLSCGLSKPVGYAVAVRDSAPAARLTRPPFPCNTRTEVEFELVRDAEIDTAQWTWPE
ncbi:MAG: hypothetical protein K2O53_06280, partial [Bacteroidales bacterium]|nr:hypothetical protein [Bacteroidales bacterium]